MLINSCCYVTKSKSKPSSHIIHKTKWHSMMNLPFFCLCSFFHNYLMNFIFYLKCFYDFVKLTAIFFTLLPYIFLSFFLCLSISLFHNISFSFAVVFVNNISIPNSNQSKCICQTVSLIERVDNHGIRYRMKLALTI